MNVIKKMAKNNLVISFGVNSFFCITCLLLFGCHYELCDDWFFADNIANGRYDFTFCNFFIQLLSGAVQKIVYPINAFIFLQVIFCFLSNIIISYVLLDTFSKKTGLVLSLLVATLFSMNAYSSVTFTKTAAFLITSGILLLAWAIEKKKKWKFYFVGIFTVVLGSFYRFMIFYSVAAVFSFFFLGVALFKAKKCGFKETINTFLKGQFKKVLLVSALLLVSVFSFQYASNTIICSNSQMNYYSKYTSARSQALDYSIPPYEEKTEEYQKLGISENDYNMLLNWYLDDEGCTDLNTLEAVSKMGHDKVNHLSTIKRMIASELYTVVHGSPEGILILAYLIISILVLTIFDKKGVIITIFITISIAALYTYLWLKGRVIYRAIFSIWLASIVLLLYSTHFLEISPTLAKLKKRITPPTKIVFKRVGLSISFFLLVFVFILTSFVFPPNYFDTSDIEYPDLESYISSSDKHFALSFNSYIALRNAFEFDNALLLYENQTFDKCLYYGTPYYAHPSYEERLSKANVSNLYVDLIDNDEIMFIDFRNDISSASEYESSEINMFIAYINEQYSRNVEAVLVTTIDDFNVYAIKTRNN